MAFSRVVRGETVAEASLVSVLAKGFLEIWPRIVRITVARLRRGRQSPDMLLEDLDVAYNPEEDREHAAHQLASAAVALAEQDAEGKRVRYRFVALGASLPTKSELPELYVLEAWIDSPTDEPAASRDSEAISMLAKANDFMGKIGEQYNKLLGNTNALVGVVVTAMEKLASVVQSQGDAEWKYKAEIHKSRMDTGERIAEMRVGYQRSHDWHETVRQTGDKYAPIVEQLLAFIQSRATGGGAPTPAEIDVVFVDHEDLAQLAKQFLATAEPQERANVRAELLARWKRLSDEQRQAVVMHCQELAPERVASLAAWLKMVGF